MGMENCRAWLVSTNLRMDHFWVKRYINKIFFNFYV